MQNSLPKLKQLVNAVYLLSETEWSALAEIWTPYAAKRKEVLTTAGEAERFLYFVIDGVQRVYYFDDAGREATIVFTYPPSFGGVLDALLCQQPSRYFYETVTPSSFLRAPFAKLDLLMQHHSGIEQMVRKVVTAALSGVME